MKKVRYSATVTIILGLLSVVGLIFLFLALSDIADMERNLTLEWHITGISIIILSTFVISTYITLGLVMKYCRIFEKDISAK